MPKDIDRLLLVAFKYPPYAGVGGKRWAKLSKYLARQGVTVDVVTVEWPDGDPSTLEDVSDDRIRIHQIPALSPNRIRSRGSNTVAERVRNRLYRDFIAGRPVSQDAAWWGPAVIPATARIARAARSQAIIVTGAPFMSNLWIARGKRFLPRVPLVQEFRDPWADLPDASLDAQGGRDRVGHLEREVLESADAAVTVTEGLSEIIRCKTGATPVHTVTNGFDAEDLPAPSSGPRPFRLIHGGNLFVGRDEPLRALLSAVTRSASELPGLELVFRGGFPEDVRREYAALESAGILKVLPSIPAREFMVEVDGAFAALQFNARQFPYLVSTKIYEYAAVGRPVLSLNYGGEIDALVRRHGLGWSVNAHGRAAITEALCECHTAWKRESGQSIEAKGIDRYSYAALADQYRDLVSTLAWG